MSDFDNDLHQLIRSAADQISIPPSPVGHVVARGQTRHRRQRTISVVAAVVVIAATAVVTLSARGTRSPGTSIAARGALPHASATLQWKAVNAAAPLGFDSSLTSGGATTLYALSTAPGVAATDAATIPNVLYRSTDGVNWSVEAGPGGVSLGAVTADGNRVYTVGTGAATAAVGHGSFPSSFQIASSTDGSSWQRLGLNIDLTSILAQATSNGTELARITSGPSGVLVVVTVNAALDLTKVLPAGAPAAGSWAATATGVTLLSGQCPGNPVHTFSPDSALVQKTGQATTTTPAGPVATSDPALCYDASGNRSVVAASTLGAVRTSYTWAQLGISGNAERAVLDEPFGFVSTDGSTFHPVTLPARPGMSEPDIVAGPNGFALVGADRVTTADSQLSALWQSATGADWSEAPAAPDQIDYSEQLGVLGGHFAVAESGVTPEVETLVGGSWAVSRLDRIAGPTAADLVMSSFGPLGFAGVLQTRPARPATTGASKTTSAPPAPEPPASLVFSPDGLTWSSRSLADIAQTTVGQPTTLAVTASQVVVVVPKGADPGTPNVPRPSLALVGTPGAVG